MFPGMGRGAYIDDIGLVVWHWLYWLFCVHCIDVKFWSVFMHVFLIRMKEMHGHKLGMLCQSPVSDTTFGSVRISGLPKSTNDSYAYTVEMYWHSMLRCSHMLAIPQKYGRACVWECLSLTLYLYVLFSNIYYHGLLYRLRHILINLLFTDSRYCKRINDKNGWLTAKTNWVLYYWDLSIYTKVVNSYFHLYECS
jgi:hypothetical protein